MKKHLLLTFVVFLLACTQISERYPYGLSRASLLKYKSLPKLDLVLNKDVENSLEYFLLEDRRYLHQSYANRKQYHDGIKYIFDAYGIPKDLINIAAIESKFNRKARSKYGAVGMWQFMKPTGRVYGLSINLFNDERKDVYLSTEAAARMLRDLYSEFGDWTFALAAYNAGSTRMRSLKRNHPNRDIWYMARNNLLPSQTKAFVSRVIAASIIEKEHLLRVERLKDNREFAGLIKDLKVVFS